MDLMDSILQRDSRLRLCWVGNDGWLFAHDGHIIATDLDFFLPERVLPQFSALSALADRLDVLFITHAHTDHFNPDTVQALLAQGRCVVVLPESCRAAAAEYELDSSRLRFIAPGRIPLDAQNNPLPLPRVGGWVPGLLPWLSAQAIPAVHGSAGGAIYGGARPDDCGYCIVFGGKKIVQPGDSVLMDEHLALEAVDVLLVSTTEHNMDVGPARRLVEALRPRHVFAQHFGTYRETEENAFWTHGRPQELRDALTPDMQARFVIPEYETVYPL